MTHDANTTLYFVYGWQLDAGLLARCCPGARVVTTARLPGHALGFYGHNPKWAGAEEGLVACPDGAAWGLVLALDRMDAQRMDLMQNVHGDGSGSYFHFPAGVEGADGKHHEVLLYMKASLGVARPPSLEYRDLLVAGAEAHGLPAGHVEGLRSVTAYPAGHPIPHGTSPLPVVAPDLDSPCHF